MEKSAEYFRKEYKLISNKLKDVGVKEARLKQELIAVEKEKRNFDNDLLQIKGALKYLGENNV